MKRYGLAIEGLPANPLYAMLVGEGADVVFTPSTEIADWWHTMSEADVVRRKLKARCPEYVFLKELKIVQVEIHEEVRALSHS